MDFIKLLFTFTGRINRAKWWLGTVALIIVTIAGTLALNPGLLDVPEDQPLPPPSFSDVLFGLLIMIPTTALTVKRFNDRDWPNWLGYAFGALAVIFTVAPLFGYLIDPSLFGTAEWTFVGIFLLLALVTFVDNGFVGGTEGPNRYGPDPLAKS